ncbi:hypothetical protein QYS48_28740 [Marivirga arenosa]|uniref:Uncharacterized protein n=1 Tax=Marivirga arenosa TaxID=3059076 RepID=A0AA51N6Y2_9BACT|nr:hypothetical protein [Marivirga sp. ABR2-2]WMN07436.1 hypothetical protein QYS48_28740 [Marivirga sp. ABR2-2]
MMFLIQKYKTYNLDKICDIFLKELYKSECENLKPVSLPEILEKRKIYYDNQLVNETISKLEREDYIKKLKNNTRFLYLPAGMKSSNDFIQTVKNTCGAVYYYTLKNRGRSFVKTRQKFDKSISKTKSDYIVLLFDLILSLLLDTHVNVNFYLNVDISIFKISDFIYL